MDAKPLKIAVVIPAYGVARQVGAVVSAVPPIVDRIFVVDDASTDDIARGLASCANSEKTELIRRPVNGGVGAATITGMISALESGFDIIVKCDGDGQMDPADIPALIAPLLDGSADHAKGSRFHHPTELRTMPWWRLIGNVGLTFLTKLASGYWNVLDPVNGFFATRADVLTQIPLSKLSPRYFFESDLLIRLNIIEARVADVPLPARYGDEPSSLSIPRALFDFPPRLLYGLARRIFWRYLFYDVSPVAIFAFTGLVLFLFGIVFGAYQWTMHGLRGTPTPLGTIMVAVLPLTFGFQLLLQAVVLDIESTPRPDGARRRPRSWRSGGEV